jgi:hypothetical protein
MASIITRVAATLDALNEATDWISISYQNPDEALDMGIVADSDFVGTITLQKKYTYDGTEYIRDVVDYDGDIQRQIIDNVPGVSYRLKLTSFTAGSVVAELYK